MEFLLLKCPAGCPGSFVVLADLLNHHIAWHERPLRGETLPPLLVSTEAGAQPSTTPWTTPQEMR